MSPAIMSCRPEKYLCFQKSLIICKFGIIIMPNCQCRKPFASLNLTKPAKTFEFPMMKSGASICVFIMIDEVRTGFYYVNCKLGVIHQNTVIIA